MTNIIEHYELETAAAEENSINNTRPIPSFGSSDVEVDALSSPSEIEQLSLPPTDGGKDAYTVLASCSLLQFPIWGLSLAFGIFQEYYANNPDIGGRHGNSTGVIGTTISGIMYLSMPIGSTLLTRYPRFRRFAGPLGLGILSISMLLSAFTTTPSLLLASQGVLSAIGSSLLFTPSSLYLDEWFIRKKGLAYGTMWSSKSAAGVALPFLARAGLSRFGYRVTMIAWAVGTILFSIPALFFLRPRVPHSDSAASGPRRLSWTFLRQWTFWMLQVGNTIQATGYYLPFTYASSYAHDIGLSPGVATLMTSLLNAPSILASVIFGLLGDRISIYTIIFVSSIGSAIPVFLLWGLSATSASFAAFSIFYGFFAGGFSATWSGILNEVKNEEQSADTGLVFGLLAGGRGLGFVVSGPVGASLLRQGSLIAKGSHYWGYGTIYGRMVIFTGCTAMFGAWACGWRAVRWMK